MSCQATAQQRKQWTTLVDLYARSYGLSPGQLDIHAAEYHYTAGARLRVVLAEATCCLVASGDVHACV